MPVRIETDDTRLEIVVRQGLGSLAAFVAMVVVIGIAASSRGRAVGDPAWVWWPIGLGLAALVWSTYALSAEERYVFDQRAGTFEIRHRSLFGARSMESGALVGLLDVRTAWIGYDDAVRGVEVTRRTAPPLRLPLRTTGLSEEEQSRIATAIDAAVRAGRLVHIS